MAFEDIGVRVLVLGLGEFRRGVGTARDDVSGLEKTIRKAGTSSEAFSQTLNRVGSAMVGAGRALTLGITTPLALLTGTLVNAGIQFEDTFAGIGKTVDGVTVGFDEIASKAKSQLGITVTTIDETKAAADKLGISFGDLTAIGEDVRNEFRELALTVPISSSELNALGETIGALGVSAEDIADVTKIVAELGVATDISAQDAATGLVRIFNIIGGEGDNIVDFLKSAGSAIVALGNNSVSTEGEILALAQRLAAAGDRAKFSTPELLAWSTTIADVGSRAEAGGTAVSRALNEMILAVQTGSENLETFAQVSGMSAEEFSKAFEEDASAALLNFIANLNSGIKAGTITKDMLNDMGLGGIRALDVLGRLSEATDIYTKNLDISNTAWAEQIALGEEAEKRFNTVTSQIQLAKNAFTDLGITLFDLVKDDLENFIKGIRNVIKWFKSLSPIVQKNLIKFAAIAAAIGPLLVVLGGLVQVLGVVSAIFTALASPIGIAALAIAGLVVAIGSMIGWDKIVETISGAFDGLMQSVGAVLEIFDLLATKKASIEDVIAALAGDTNASTRVGGGQQSVSVAPSGVGATDFAHATTAPETENRLQESVAALGIPPQFITDLMTISNSLSGFQTAFDTVSTAITNMFEGIVSNPAFQAVVVKFPADMQALGESIFNFITQALSGVGDFTSGFASGFAPFLEGVGPKLGDIIARVTEALSGLTPMFDSISNTTSKIPWEVIGRILGQIAGLVFNALVDGLTLAVDIFVLVFDAAVNVTRILQDVYAIFWDLVTGTELGSQKMQDNWERLVTSVRDYFETAFNDIKQIAEDFVNGIIDGFNTLYNTLVGHSIIPDLTSDILAEFSGMVTDTLALFDSLVKKGSEILANLFSGGNSSEATAPTTEFAPDQFAAAQAAIVAMQSAWTTFITDAQTQLATFMAALSTSLQQIGIDAPTAFQALDFAIAASVGNATTQFANMQTVAVTAFAAIGTSASSVLTGDLLGAANAMISSMVTLLTMLDLYFLDTVKHMYGHWLDFVAGADALSSMWADHTIAIFDRIHNEGVGKIHQIRDAWKESSTAMEGDSGALGDSVNSVAGAFSKVAGAAAGAGAAVWAAARQMIEAMKAVQAAATGSPELKIHHSFERFEKYLKRTDFGNMIDSQVTMPSYMTQVNPMMPTGTGSNVTTIDRSINTGDFVGAGLDTQDEVVDTLTRVMRMSGAVGGV